VHSKKRNALHSDTIEAEMMIKFNTRSVEQRATAAASFGQCREQTEDAASDDDELFAEADNVSVATEVEVHSCDGTRPKSLVAHARSPLSPSAPPARLHFYA